MQSREIHTVTSPHKYKPSNDILKDNRIGNTPRYLHGQKSLKIICESSGFPTLRKSCVYISPAYQCPDFLSELQEHEVFFVFVGILINVLICLFYVLNPLLTLDTSLHLIPLLPTETTVSNCFCEQK